MQVRFWGVRGSVAVSGTPYIHTGGNTTCVEVVHEGHRLILDGGTGLHALGQHMGPGPHHVHILFSHVHWDHIQGVPFFAPAFHPDSRLTMVGVARPTGTILDALGRQMRPPQFPVSLAQLPATLSSLDCVDGAPFEVGPFRITAADMHHPDGVVAWRIEAGGRSVVFATDVEHGDHLDRRLVDLAQGTDLLIHDAQYTTEEYAHRRGWGHSPWEHAVAVAVRADAVQTRLFHHDPLRDDAAVVAIETLARQRRSSVSAAREGAMVCL